MIFVVEDDDATRDAICLLLECASLPVRGFHSCDLMVAAADPRAAECLVLDVQMTGTTGIELLERLHAEAGAPPAILMSGAMTDDIRRRATAAGALALLEKPFRGTDLVALVTNAPGVRRPAPPARRSAARDGRDRAAPARRGRPGAQA